MCTVPCDQISGATVCVNINNKLTFPSTSLTDGGAAYGTAKAGMGIGAMGVMHPQLVMRNIIPVVMAGVLGIYGLIVSVILLGSSKFCDPFLPFPVLCCVDVVCARLPLSLPLPCLCVFLALPSPRVFLAFAFALALHLPFSLACLFCRAFGMPACFCLAIVFSCAIFIQHARFLFGKCFA